MKEAEVGGRLPIVGKSDEMARSAAIEEWKEHMIQLAPVDNTVLWVNPAFSNLPFSLKVGMSADVGVFAEDSFSDRPGKLRDGRIAGEAWVKHRRSVILGRFSIEDREGRGYRDIDLKGIGRLETSKLGRFNNSVYVMGNRVGKLISREDQNWEGLLHQEIAEYDRNMGEMLLSQGIRAPRAIGIIALNEIISNRQKKSVFQMKENGQLDKEVKPVLEIRAFGTRIRLEDLEEKVLDDQYGLAKLIVDDAIEIVSEELGLTAIMSHEEYFQWFGKTLGKNVGLVHKNGWIHKYLTGHNIALDCRIVDFDSLERHSDSSEKIIKDIKEARGSLSFFAGFIRYVLKVRAGKASDLIQELGDNFDAGYLSALGAVGEEALHQSWIQQD